MPSPPDPPPTPPPPTPPAAMAVPAAPPHIPNACVKTGDIMTEAGVLDGSSIPYAVMWNPTKSTYGESAGEKTPTTITAKIRVNWEDANKFTQFARGFALWGGGVEIRRRLPLKCPWDHELYCNHVEFSQIGKDAGVDPDPLMRKWPSAEWVEYTVTFTVRPYDLKQDGEVVAIGSELARYVTRKRRYNYKERRINPGQLLFADGTPSMVPSFVPFVGSEIEYLWHMVPAVCVDFDAIAKAMGKVNSVVFDEAKHYGTRPVGGPFAAETLLFVGFANPWVTYPMSNGEPAFDIPFLFRENPYGWNNFPKPDGTLSKVTLRGTAESPYKTTDLAALFQSRE